MLIDPNRLAELERAGVRTERPLTPPAGDPAADAGRRLSTGLCDLQVNGFAGVDYNDPALTPEALERSLLAMLGSGVTRCLPTVITAPFDWQRDCFRALEAGRGAAASSLAARMIAGYHLEGPFLNPEPGYCGCHPAGAMVPGDWDYFQRLQDAAGGLIRLVTVAPERPGVLALIPRWVASGVVVAVGHSGADYDTLRCAVDAGATLSTHLGNGLPQTLAKRDNTLLAQLALDGLSASFIADGYHLRRHVLGVYLRAKQAERTVLVTDATAGSRAAPGRYTLGQVALARGDEPVVHIPGTQSLAGSATTLDACVRNVVAWYRTPFATALRWAGEQPRELIGLPPLPPAGEPVEWVWWKTSEAGPVVERARIGDVEAAAPAAA